MVAGAVGFLGAKLCENFLDLGFEVIGLDNFLSSQKTNLAKLRDNPQFSFLEVDLTKKLPAVAFKGSLLAVVHAASIENYPSGPSSHLNPLVVNAFGVKNLLDFCLRKKARFVFCSTIDVYEGLASRLSLDHYYDGRQASAKFSVLEAKRFSESLCQEYFQSFNLDIRIARLPEIYGPAMNLEAGSLVAKALRLALDNKDLLINEDGSQKRELLYVDDAAFGLVKLVVSQTPDLAGKIVYLGSREYVSNLSIVYTLKELINSSLKVDFLPPLAAPENLSKAAFLASDLSRAKKLLAWEAKVDLSQGLRETVDYFKNLKGLNSSAYSGLSPSGSKTDGQNEKPEILPENIDLSQDKIVKPKELFLDSLAYPLGVKKGSLFAGLLPPTVEKIKGVEGKKNKFRPPLLFKKVILGLLLIFVLAMIGQAFLLFSLKNDLSLINKNWQSNQEKPLTESLLRFKNDLAWQQKFLVLEKPFFLVSNNLTMYQNMKELLAGSVVLLDSAEKYVGPSLELKQDLLKLADSSPLLGGSDSSIELLPDIVKNLNKFSAIKDDIDAAKKHWSKIDAFKMPSRLLSSSQWTKLMADLDLGEETLTKLVAISDQLPKVLAQDVIKHYLLLFQNSTELRATGGFIGSFGILTINKGRLVDLAINDIYNPDGLIKTKLPAPAFLQQYLSVGNLGMRDANYSPDFETSAKRIAFLYKDATGEEVDGIIAINLSVMEDFLRAVGPLYLSDYKETITADNLFEKAQIQAEVDFKPGSTRKKDFLSSLAGRLFEIAKTKKDSNWNELIFSLAKRLEQKDIFFYFSDPLAQKALESLDWLGRMKETDGDYLWLIDSNVSANKANLWVKRSANYVLSVDRDGNLLANLTVSWNNQAISQTWPSGDYKNYFRVYVPFASEIIKTAGFASKIETGEEQGKTVFAGLVEVPISKVQEISISYKLPVSLSLLKKSNYSLLIQKQSGVGNESFSFRIDLPVFLETTGKTSFNLNLTHDNSFDLTTQRQLP